MRVFLICGLIWSLLEIKEVIMRLREIIKGNYFVFEVLWLSGNLVLLLMYLWWLNIYFLCYGGESLFGSFGEIKGRFL